MSQHGCLRASAAVMRSSSAAGTSRKAPPEAVSTNRFTDEGISPTRHWKMAECSESTGMTGARHRFASAMTSSPATTRVSLLARAIFLPARTAASVGARPAKPTMADTTVSTEEETTDMAAASSPVYTLIGRWAKASESGR